MTIVWIVWLNSFKPDGFQVVPCYSPFQEWQWWKVMESMCFCYQMGGWISRQRGSETQEPKEKQGSIIIITIINIYILFHLVAFVLIYMWIFVGKNVHSLNASVNKHPFVGMFPKSKQWGAWAMSLRTSVWDSEERVWKLQVALQKLQLSCYTPPPPAPGSSHSPPHFVWSHWGIWSGWQRRSNRLQPWTWGWTSGVKVQPRRGLGHLGIETNIWICIVFHVISSLASDSWIRFNFKYKGFSSAL